MKQSIYKELNDPDWLRQKYVVEQKSSVYIYKMLQCKSQNSVRQALIRHGFHVRNQREAQKITSEDDYFVLDHELIEGSLLGDGYLGISNKKSKISCPFYTQKSKDLDFIKLMAQSIFVKDGHKRIAFEDAICPWTGVERRYYIVRSLSQDCLRPYFDRWYPATNNYVKLVPQDLCLTPRVLLFWFLGDGFTWQRRKESKKKQALARFCTEGFTKVDQEFLRSLMKTIGLSTRLTNEKHGTGHRVEVQQGSYSKLMELLGPCPIESMQHKWK